MVEKLNVSSALIKQLEDKFILSDHESNNLKAKLLVGWAPNWLATILYQMIERKSCEKQLRFFEVVREKQPCLVTEQDMADLAESAWNWHH